MEKRRSCNIVREHCDFLNEGCRVIAKAYFCLLILAKTWQLCSETFEHLVIIQVNDELFSYDKANTLPIKIAT